MAAAGDRAARLPGLFRFRLRLYRPLQGEVALHVIARSLQHRARHDRPRSDAFGPRLRAGGAEYLWHVLLRQDHDRALLAAADRVSVGPAHRLPLFPVHPDAAARQGRRFDADPRGRPHRRRRRPPARDRKRGGDEDPAGGHPVAVAGRSWPSHPRHLRAGGSRRHRERVRRPAQSRHDHYTARADAERARAGTEAGNDLDAGAAARARHQPASLARRRRRGAAACAGQRGRPAPAPRCQDRLPPRWNPSCRTSRSS